MLSASRGASWHRVHQDRLGESGHRTSENPKIRGPISVERPRNTKKLSKTASKTEASALARASRCLTTAFLLSGGTSAILAGAKEHRRPKTLRRVWYRLNCCWSPSASLALPRTTHGASDLAAWKEEMCTPALFVLLIPFKHCDRPQPGFPHATVAPAVPFDGGYIHVWGVRTAMPCASRLQSSDWFVFHCTAERCAVLSGFNVL